MHVQSSPFFSFGPFSAVFFLYRNVFVNIDYHLFGSGTAAQMLLKTNLYLGSISQLLNWKLMVPDYPQLHADNYFPMKLVFQCIGYEAVVSLFSQISLN